MPHPAIFDAYLQHLEHERRLAARTLALYRQALWRIPPLLHTAQISMAQCQAHHIRLWVAALHREGLGAKTLAITLSAWRGLFKYMGEQRLMANNPAVGIRPPKASKPLPKALGVDHAVALAERSAALASQALPSGNGNGNGNGNSKQQFLSCRDHAMVELLYGCGLRVGELVGLNLSPLPGQGWLDAQDATLHVVGKGNKGRSLPLGEVCLKAIQQWLAIRGRADTPAQPQALFITQQGQRVSSSLVRGRLRQLAMHSGIDGLGHVHPHMLRHSFASHVLQSSGDLRGVQELLGHSSISSTQVYTRLDFQHLAHIYDQSHPRAKRANVAVSPTEDKKKASADAQTSAISPP